MLEFELVLPCYNESKSLGALIERAVGAARAAGHTPDQFRLVLVENGSKDDSRLALEKLSQGEWRDWFRVVPVTVNQGYGFGLWSGLKTTTAKYVGWSHADQQCDPKDAFKALQLVKADGAPKVLVKGTRSGRNWKDRVVSFVFMVIARLLLRFRFTEINAQPKVFPRELLKEITDPPFTFAFDLYVLFRAMKAGYVVREIPVLFPPRVHGVSNWAATFWGRHKTILGMIRYMWELRRTQ